jgi:hypothetical protein
MHTQFNSFAVLSRFHLGFSREKERLDDITGCRYNAQSRSPARSQSASREAVRVKADLATDRNIHQPGSGSCAQCRKSRHEDKHERLWVQT